MKAQYNQIKTRADAERKKSHSHGSWGAKLELALARRKLSRFDWKRMNALFGLRAYDGPIRASDLAAARKLTDIYIDVVDRLATRKPELRWFHVTLLCDEAIVNERASHLALKRLKAKAYQTLASLQLNAVVCIDVNSVPNYPQQGEGGSFLFHIHALCFTDQPFNLKNARKKLTASKSWTCSLDAAPTNIVEITTLGSPSFWAAYDSKAPFEAKNYRVKANGKCALWPTESGLRPTVAMRLQEGLSHFALRDMMFGVGEGRKLRKSIFRRLGRWQSKRWPGRKRITAFDHRALWIRLWKASRSKRYTSWTVVGSSLRQRERCDAL